VEVSLEPAFERHYSSLHDAVDNFFIASSSQQAVVQRRQRAMERLEIIAGFLPTPSQYPFWLFGIDTTPNLRPFAATLADRGVVYSPNPAPGNQPIGIGHRSSVLALLPEREAGEAPWVVPLSCERVPTNTTDRAVAVDQMAGLLTNQRLPFGNALTVEVVDSSYSRARYLHPVGGYANHIVVARLAANRRLYHVLPEDVRPQRGHPRWYGAPFKLDDESTWGAPAEILQVEWHTSRGRVLQIVLQRWNDFLVRGKRDAPMQQRPFDVIRCWAFDDEGNLVFKRSLWLMVLGKRRHEIGVRHCYEAYRQRFDLEHFFRFGKHHLLLDRYQTPEVEHDRELVGNSLLSLHPVVVGRAPGSGRTKTLGTLPPNAEHPTAPRSGSGTAGLRADYSAVWDAGAVARTPW
jgi:DDE superfamily endonuclease